MSIKPRAMKRIPILIALLVCMAAAQTQEPKKSDSTWITMRDIVIDSCRVSTDVLIPIPALSEADGLFLNGAIENFLKKLDVKAVDVRNSELIFITLQVDSAGAIAGVSAMTDKRRRDLVSALITMLTPAHFAGRKFGYCKGKTIFVPLLTIDEKASSADRIGRIKPVLHGSFENKAFAAMGIIFSRHV